MELLNAGSQGPAGGNIIAFVRPAATTAAHLSRRDRADIAAWKNTAKEHGYDRMVIHERSDFDPPDVEAFLAVYRRHEVWATWNLARCGDSVLAWWSRSGTDFGRFATVAEALEALLMEDPLSPEERKKVLF